MYGITAPKEAGFGNCKHCPFRETGTVHICYGCAARTVRTPSADCCQVCNQELRGARQCSNDLCNDPARAFERINAIAMKTRPLESAIWSYKYEGKWGWGLIFSRVLLGYLYAHPEVLEGSSAIIPMPAWLQDRSDRRKDHARWVIEQAIQQDERSLPFVLDPPLIHKRSFTGKMKDTASLFQRQEEGKKIYRALEVPDASRVRGRRIMVYDDVFTSGTTRNAVAQRLREADARSVVGIALARQPWGS